MKGRGAWTAAALCMIVAAWVLPIGPLAVARKADATAPGTIELTLPRPVGPDEAVWLQVRTGALAGAEIHVRTSDGELLGTVSPFGGRRDQGGVTYTIPVPKAAIRDGRIRLRLDVHAPDGPARAPRPGEVEDVTLIYVPVTR
jgi:hypothetical protein